MRPRHPHPSNTAPAFGCRIVRIAPVHFAMIVYVLWRISREGPIPNGNKSPVDTGEERLVA